MIKYFLSRSMMERGLIGIFLCVLLFIFGYFFVLNYVSTLEKPPLGNTLYILIGSTLTIISILGIFVLAKYLYDYKKRKLRQERKRNQHKLVYLKDKRRPSKDGKIE